MPIEIKELHIKAVVVAEQQPMVPTAAPGIAKLKKEITDEVLRKVHRQLKQKNER
ncbi:DUF5908 family protein [Parapedobacter sp. 10938]|uniref:DUF5908 family protein n=1 Tax=Parapedobacter flavus TaxID=3110225 RepID=UPI002DBCE2BF|nr:DUF5908 family protein [Parapedobacter sp. 10938]MEC3881892.1 DUF5908 family protein [Parapedobacter sp. 10938]